MHDYSTEDEPLPVPPSCLICGRHTDCSLCRVPREALTRRWLDG